MRCCHKSAVARRVFFSHGLNNDAVVVPMDTCGRNCLYSSELCWCEIQGQYRNIQFLQDFISGAILIAFTGVLVPDVFPKVELPSMISYLSSELVDDQDLQVGPPRLAGR
jgi:hypothetical protein